MFHFDDPFEHVAGDLPLVLRLLVSAGIGFLIGLEREFAKKANDKQEHLTGVRTNTLFALFGSLAALLAERYGPGLFIAALAGFIALTIVAYALSAMQGHFGGTTEISGILTFILGALVYQGYVLLGVVVCVVVLLLLSFKVPLHGFVRRLTIEEIRAFVQFIIISALVLPFLPNRHLGPLGAWNPREIWTMVVLVSGMSLVGYMLGKFLGGRGTLLSGALGGLVSSTATTLSMSRQARGARTDHGMLALGIVAASTVMFPRVLLLVVLVGSDLAASLWPAMLVATIGGVGVLAWMRRRRNSQAPSDVAVQNPLNFVVAVQFAAIYALVRWLIAYGDSHFGAQGTYAASCLGGLTDMDAIALSLARSSHQAASIHVAVIAVLLAALVNTLVKMCIAFFVGGGPLRRAVWPGFATLVLSLSVTIVIALVQGT